MPDSKPDYEAMYFQLFAALADVVDALDAQNYGTAKQIIIDAQRKTEEEYMSA